jgi:hypothetical protein
MKAHNLEHKSNKVNNALLGVIAIFAIFLLVYFAVSSKVNAANTVTNVGQDIVTQNADYAGQVSQVLVEQDVMSCKLLVGQTTLYDDNTLAVSLEASSSTYYSGNVITVVSVNENGCVIDISGNSDYLAIGQIQRLGSLYVTVKDVVQ